MTKYILALVPLLVLFGAINTIRTSFLTRTQASEPSDNQSANRSKILSPLHAVSLHVYRVSIGRISLSYPMVKTEEFNFRNAECWIKKASSWVVGYFSIFHGSLLNFVELHCAQHGRQLGVADFERREYHYDCSAFDLLFKASVQPWSAVGMFFGFLRHNWSTDSWYLIFWLFE